MGKDTIRDVQSGREGKKALWAVYLIIYSSCSSYILCHLSIDHQTPSTSSISDVSFVRRSRYGSVLLRDFSIS